MHTVAITIDLPSTSTADGSAASDGSAVDDMLRTRDQLTAGLTPLLDSLLHQSLVRGGNVSGYQLFGPSRTAEPATFLLLLEVDLFNSVFFCTVVFEVAFGDGVRRRFFGNGSSEANGSSK